MSAAVIERRSTEDRMPGPCPVITSRHLVLRPHRVSDADSIAQSLADFSVSRMLARVPQPYDREDARNWLQIRLSGSSPDWAMAITTGDDVHIGIVSLELRGGSWHLGYWLNRLHWGKGIMTEAVDALLDLFVRRMPDTEIHSGVFADNSASLKIQQKLGFRITNCNELFNLARNSMVPHIETLLRPEDLRRP